MIFTSTRLAPICTHLCSFMPACTHLYQPALDLGGWSQRTVSNISDEEVIMLAQNGKIQAYALERVFGDLERTVTTRRALICKSSLVCH